MLKYNMSNKSLLETNPHLKNPKVRKQIIETVTVSSSAIEGVHAPARQAVKNIARAKTRATASSGKAQT